MIYSRCRSFYEIQSKRPYNSRLDRTEYVKCGFTKLPDWKDSLTNYLKEIGRL